MRKMYPRNEDIYQVPSWIPVTFVVLASAIVVSLTIFKPIYTVPGLVISLLGLPVYKLWNKRRKKFNIN